MGSLRPLLAGLLLLGLPLLAGAVAPATDEAKPVAAEGREILVMLKMPRQHYRPGSGYSGNYGDLASQAARRRIASEIAGRNGLEVRKGWPMPLLGVDCYVMLVPAGKSIDAVIAGISKQPEVAWSQRMHSYAIGSGRQPPLVGSAPDPLYPIQPTAREWKLRELQRAATGRGVKVAIIDSKVDVRHPDLSGQFVADRNFVDLPSSVPEAHGTHVAGIIAAKVGNGIGIAGVAPGAKLMALRACREVDLGMTTLCQSLALAKALEFAIDNNANIINLSLSGPSDPLLSKLLQAALERKITVIAAFDQKLPQGGFPASFPGVIPVIDEALQSVPKGVYSAPGRDLPTTQPGGGWSLVDGTSYAVAQVSGLAALANERGRRPFASFLVRASDGRVEACATLLGPSPSCS